MQGKYPNAATVPAANRIRDSGDRELQRLLDRLYGDEKHYASSLSTLDVLWVLYHQVLDLSPGRVADPLRDRFILSKGHGPAAYYAVLAAKGYIDETTLDGFSSFESALGHHPDRLLVPGVELSSGSLGHGLAMAVGMALGLRLQHPKSPRVICLVGDGELEEGSNHEAIALASRYQLERLTVIVVDNQSSELGWPGGVAERFEVEGWLAETVPAHDRPALVQALSRRAGEGPNVVVARSQS